MSSIMRGAGKARQIIATHLATDMPMLIAAARDQWGLEEWQLPVPVRYDSYDPLMVDNYPTVGSLVTRTNDWRRTDITPDAAEVYEATYSMQVFVWCRTLAKPDGTYETPEYDSVLRVRDDMLALIRGCLLRKPSFGSPVCQMDEGSLTEDYLDAIKGSDQSPRWMSGGTLSFNIELVEENYQQGIGTADTVEVETGLLIP